LLFVVVIARLLLIATWGHTTARATRHAASATAHTSARHTSAKATGTSGASHATTGHTAAEADGINYPQIINSQKIATDAYGINGIPEIILFAPDGTILARGLRGNEIEKKMAEFFVE
jgi:hypothetical protein